MTKSPEQLDEYIRRVQDHGDVSAWKRNPEDTGLVNLVSILHGIPKADAPKANLLRVRTRILDKISLPQETVAEQGIGFLQALPRILKVAGGLVGAFTIMLSLTIGTAVAALESVPGQTIYPVKRMVENVQLKLASTQEEKTNLQIKFTNIRVDEMEVILQKQKEGKASDQEVEQVVASTIQDIREASQAVADQTKNQPNVALLAKIVDLSDRQTEVITAAQPAPGHLLADDLSLALEVSRTAKDQAIENIERAGLVVESQPMTIGDGTDRKNMITAEGELTAITDTQISIGTVQFLLTDETEYDKITLVELAVGDPVKITGETRDGKTYATKIESQLPPLTPSTPQSPDSDGPVEQTPTDETEEPETIQIQ